MSFWWVSLENGGYMAAALGAAALAVGPWTLAQDRAGEARDECPRRRHGAWRTLARADCRERARQGMSVPFRSGQPALPSRAIFPGNPRGPAPHSRSRTGGPQGRWPPGNACDVRLLLLTRYTSIFVFKGGSRNDPFVVSYEPSPRPFGDGAARLLYAPERVRSFDDCSEIARRHADAHCLELWCRCAPDSGTHGRHEGCRGPSMTCCYRHFRARSQHCDLMRRGWHSSQSERESGKAQPRRFDFDYVG